MKQKAKSLLGEFMNRARESHSAVFGLALTFLTYMIAPELMVLPLALAIAALGGTAILDMLPVVGKAVRQILESKWGRQIEKEVAYYLGGAVAGYVLAVLVSLLANPLCHSLVISLL